MQDLMQFVFPKTRTRKESIPVTFSNNMTCLEYAVVNRSGKLVSCAIVFHDKLIKKLLHNYFKKIKDSENGGTKTRGMGVRGPIPAHSRCNNWKPHYITELQSRDEEEPGLENQKGEVKNQGNQKNPI